MVFAFSLDLPSMFSNWGTLKRLPSNIFLYFIKYYSHGRCITPCDSSYFYFLLAVSVKHIYCIVSVWLSRWINKCQFILNLPFVSYHPICCWQVYMYPVSSVDNCMLSLFVGSRRMWLDMFVCGCIRDAFQGCVWDAAQVSVGVCCTTSLQGTGYQAEREAIMLITLHTPRQPSVQHNCRAHAQTHLLGAPAHIRCRAHAHIHTRSAVFLSFCRFSVFLLSLFEDLGHLFPFAFKKDCFIF